jgi:hypothetical protein
VVSVVVAGIALLSLVLWWALNTYIFSEPEEVDAAQTTTSEDGGGDPVNLALGRPVTGTGRGSDLPGLVVDGKADTGWNSGDFAPQVIQIDLEKSSTIQTIRLLPGQSPNGETEHIIFGLSPGETEPVVLHTFEGFTNDKQWLAYTPDTPWKNIDKVAVGTRRSPSWVAWFEIVVIGTSP